MPSLRGRVLVFSIVAASCLVAPTAQAAQPCFAEVVYLDRPSGHTYEYRCGPRRLHAGQIVRVPVNHFGTLEMTTARIVRISSHRTYFGGPLKTVAGIR